MSTSARIHRPVRIQTIVWGAMLIAAAAITFAISISGPLSAAGVLWIVLGFGAILILGAIAAGITRAARAATSREAADGILTTPVVVDAETNETPVAPSSDTAPTIELPRD
jgi:predicted phage tail protein